MNTKYTDTIAHAMKSGGILDAMLALQARDGYLTGEAVEALAVMFEMPPAAVYDTASFYSMIRLAPPEGKVDIRICRGAPCHVAGAADVIAAIKKMLGIQIGGTTPDGKYSFDYVECLGQCQASPSVLVNEKLYTDMTPEKVPELLKKGGLKA